MRPTKNKRCQPLLCRVLITTTLMSLTAAADAATSGSLAARGAHYVDLFMKRLRDFTPREPTPRHGYLSLRGPTPLRFSDEYSTTRRPPSPALPEFTIISEAYDPYLIETRLPDDAFDREILADVMVELDPYVIVSGKIDTSLPTAAKPVQTIDTEDAAPAALRPEEVLIFFEKQSQSGNRSLVIPVSPPAPPPETVKSSAILKTEK